MTINYMDPTAEPPLDPPCPTAEELRARYWAESETARYWVLAEGLDNLNFAGDCLSAGQDGGNVIEIPVKGCRDQDLDYLLKQVMEAIIKEMGIISRKLLDAGFEPPEPEEPEAA